MTAFLLTIQASGPVMVAKVISKSSALWLIHGLESMNKMLGYQWTALNVHVTCNGAIKESSIVGEKSYFSIYMYTQHSQISLYLPR